VCFPFELECVWCRNHHCGFVQVVFNWNRFSQYQAFRAWKEYLVETQPEWDSRFLVRRPGVAGAKIDLRSLTESQLASLHSTYEREAAAQKESERVFGSKLSSPASKARAELAKDLAILTAFMKRV
jgi:hypothetical protein